MADPGVEVLRENVSIPVLGPGHASMYAAAMLGHRFSLIVTSDYSERYFLQHAHRAGLHLRLASCHAVNIPPDELTTDPGYTVELLGEVAREAVVEAGADTLILGCTNFCFLIDEIQEKLKAEKLDVLIIDPFMVSINLLAALIDAGLTQSKIAYPNAGISRSDGIPGVNLSA
jgi:allantoin racemase